MSRVMCVCSPAEANALRSALQDDDPVDLVCCDPEDSVVDEVVTERPDVLIYGLRPDSEADRAVLWLVNHVAPRLSMVLVGEEEGPAFPPEMMRRIHHSSPAASQIRGAVHEMLHGREGA